MISIDDLDFEDEEQLDTTILSICFPIYHLPIPDDENDLFDCGTGFVINSDGTFLSAGHIFKKGVGNYKAYYKESEYKIEVIYHEYDQDNGKDLFIGKLVGFKEILPFYVELAKPDLIQNENQLNFAGFNTKMVIAGEKETSGYLIKHDNYSFYGHVISAKLIETKDIPYYRLLADKRLKHNHMKVLSITSTTYAGLSGGPVFMDNKVFGVFLSDVFVTSDYIKELLKKSANTASKIIL